MDQIFDINPAALLFQMSFVSCIASVSNIMSSDDSNEWDEILKGKWKAYDVEKSLYVDSVNKANSPEERAKIICDGLRDGNLPGNLAKLYFEAVYGSNEKVKTRIISRTYFIRRSCR